MESNSKLGKAVHLLQSESNLGLVCRFGLFSLVMGVALGAGYMARWMWMLESLDSAHLLVVFFAVFFPMAASVVVSERPAGEAWIMLRLGLATFCRTGLPIFCVVVITLVSKKQLQPPALCFLVFFYILGILVVVLISVYRLSDKASSGKDDEVDRAPIT